MQPLVFRLALAAALAAAFSAPAAAAAPFRIEACSFDPRDLRPGGDDAAIWVRFSALVPLRAAGFRLAWGDGRTTELLDAGQFAPGIAVQHRLEFAVLGPVSAESWRFMHLVPARAAGPGGAWEADGSQPVTVCDVYPF